VLGGAEGRTLPGEYGLTANRSVIVSERQLDGRTIHVVDGLFDRAYVRVLHETFKALPFRRQEYSTEATKNVRHWSHEFGLDSLAVALPLRAWRDAIVSKTVELVAGRDVSLNRVHVNSQSYGDVQHAHQDVVSGVTSLYFANAEWAEDWDGELILYNREGEPFHAVAPRPGRLVVFAGDILHRGGIPSRTCLEPRLTVAFKFKPAD